MFPLKSIKRTFSATKEEINGEKQLDKSEWGDDHVGMHFCKPRIHLHTNVYVMYHTGISTVCVILPSYRLFQYFQHRSKGTALLWWMCEQVFPYNTSRTKLASQLETCFWPVFTLLLAPFWSPPTRDSRVTLTCWHLAAGCQLCPSRSWCTVGFSELSAKNGCRLMWELNLRGVKTKREINEAKKSREEV